MRKNFILATFLFPSLALSANVFGDAKWIGPAGDDLPVYADYLPVFKIDFTADIPAGGKASLIYGADDPRLMDANLNIYNLANKPGSSAIKVVLEPGKGINVYRYGYHPADKRNVPVASFKTDALKKGRNEISISSNLGITDFFVNGENVGRALLNPIGNGGDYLAFPVLADMAVEIPKGSGAMISNLKVRNYREPGNVVCRIDGAFSENSKIVLPERSMPELMTTFTVKDAGNIDNATITATARGIYDVYVNGKRVTDDYFYPGSTQYNKTHLYHTFDVKPFLRQGRNEVLARLAEGWWSGGATFVGENWNFYGDRQSFIANIAIDYADGSTDVIVTAPETWTYSVDGPIVEGSFFQGEIFDASRDASKRQWKPAVEISTDSTVNHSIGSWEGLKLMPTFGDRVIAVDTLTAVSMSEPRPGVYVYDMGQNMAALPLLTFDGLKRGDEVTVRYAEVLYPDMEQYAPNAGMIMTENLRAAMCRDIYRAAGKRNETFSPRFTLHGYRFIELTGLDNPLPLEAVRSIPVSSIHGFKAGYECSDTLVNRLWKNIEWSSLSNFISLPTDCPQRNERLGWMGDISVFSPTATKIADVSALLRQYLTSVRDCQADNGKYPDVAPTGFGFGGLLWGSAGITVPWECYKQYGDLSLLSDHYQSMKRYIDYVFNETIDPATGIIVQDRAWGDLADWLSPEYDRTDKSLLWECYLIYDLEIMKNVASLLGDSEGEKTYSELLSKRKKFFVDTYVDKEKGLTRYSAFDPEKLGKIIDTQVSYALPIAMGIYDEEKFVKNFLNTVERENIADDGTVCPPYSLMTGFIGTAWIQEALSKTGNADMAYRLLTSTSYPSWLYPVTQGATTVWERLNSYTHKDGFGKNNSMNSFNHYSFGAVGNWLITRSLGINVEDDGSLLIAPEPDASGSLTYAKGWLETPAGRVASSWRIDGEDVVVDVVAPANAKGKILVNGVSKNLEPGLNTVRTKL